jgi:hypothetical protein
MKRLFKAIMIGLVGLLILGGIASIFDDPKTGSQNEPTSPSSSDPSPKPHSELGKNTFDLSKAISLPSLLSHLDSCFNIASSLGSLSGTDLESSIQKGSTFYNRAYMDYQDLQKEAGEELPQAKSKVINEALRVYSEIFNNRFTAGMRIDDEVTFVQSSLTGFPNEISQIEKDYSEGVFRVIVGPSTRKEVNLKGNGTWCLFEIQNGTEILAEGDFPNNGFGKYDIREDQLPIFLGESKRFVVENSNARSSGIHLIFKRCEKN